MNTRIPVYIGIGSNLGDPYCQTLQALHMIAAIRDTELVDHSSLYWSDPISTITQNTFLNSVALVRSGLHPASLLSELQSIENEMGRTRTVPGGPRTIDLDILFYDTLVLRTDNLIIPHPRIHQRLFAIVPVLEITPDYQHPALNGHLRYCAEKLRNRQTVHIAYKRIPGVHAEFIHEQAHENS